VKNLLPLHLDETKYCFVCGTDNPQGLGLKPYIEGDEVVSASFIAPDYLRSFKFGKTSNTSKSILHGGMHCALLDCLSAWAFFALRRKFVATTDFHVQILKPIFTGEKVFLRAKIISENQTSVIVKGEISNSAQELRTKSKIKYKILSKDALKKLIDREK
jgi:acyl-coenzyme A thioesterase PaaI-like protein